jgi:hypothetical protein
MARVALDTFLLGGHGELHAGDEVPESWNVGGGEEFPTDFARLEELGLVKAVKSAKAKTSEPDES